MAVFGRSKDDRRLWAPPVPMPPPAPMPPPVASTWIQWPTVAWGYFHTVVGESHRQPALRDAAVMGPAGPTVRMVTAQLMREPANPADPNAVQVLVGGRPVGYLPREDAPYAHGIIDALTAEGRPTTCRAELIGGTPDKPTIGITLHTDEGWRRLGPGAAFLDCSRPQHVTTVGEQEFQPIIEQVLASSGPEVLAHLGAGPTGGATLAVYVGGRQVGWLTPKMSERYTPVLWAVHQAGFECSTRTSIERDAKGVLQVTARMLKV